MKSAIIGRAAIAVLGSGLFLSSCTMQPIDPVSRPMGYITYAVKDIKKGSVIAKTDIEAKKIQLGKIPGDNCDATDAVGKTAVEDVGTGQVLSVLDIGLPVGPQAATKMYLEDYSTSQEIKYDLLTAAKDMTKGHTIEKADLTTAQAPVYMIPMDAISDPNQAVGRSCKFAITKGQIVMQHFLLAH